eukprot:COSAG01_NODE_37810_length_498_cov_1.776942_1_plen_101_part_10
MRVGMTNGTAAIAVSSGCGDSPQCDMAPELTKHSMRKMRSLPSKLMSWWSQWCAASRSEADGFESHGVLSVDGSASCGTWTACGLSAETPAQVFWGRTATS